LGKHYRIYYFIYSPVIVCNPSEGGMDSTIHHITRQLSRARGNLYSENGSSLVEIIVLLAVIAILSMMIIPYAKDMIQNQQLNDVAYEIIMDMQETRVKSVAQKLKSRIEFIDNYQYAISCDTNRDGNFDLNEVMKLKDIRNTYNEITVTTDTKKIIFYPLGNATSALLRVSNNSLTKRIILNTIGSVKIESRAGNL